MTLQRLCSAALLVMAFTAAQAGPIYKWRDENGTLQFSSKPPPTANVQYETKRAVPANGSGSIRSERGSQLSASAAGRQRGLEIVACLQSLKGSPLLHLFENPCFTPTGALPRGTDVGLYMTACLREIGRGGYGGLAYQGLKRSDGRNSPCL